jgi:hypothetical protein
MINPFKQPLKLKETSREKFVSILVFGLFIFLFLFFFRPFGLSQIESEKLLFFTFGFGVVTTFMLIIFKYLFEPVITKGNWTLGKNILWDLLIASCIGIANYFYISIIFPQIFIFKYLLYAIFTAILVGIIPVTISYIVTFNRIYKSALKEVAIVPEDILWDNEVIVRAGNPKNEFKFNTRNIVYLCSNDNYVTIVTINRDSQNKTTILGTLKSVETELKINSRFIRCHKCYIVNLDYIEKVTGNNQNMIIRLKPSGTEIPVSRSRADHVIKRIKS